MKEIKNKQVAAVFEQYSEVIRLSLLELRTLIFEVGEATSGVVKSKKV